MKKLILTVLLALTACVSSTQQSQQLKVDNQTWTECPSIKDMMGATLDDHQDYILYLLSRYKLCDLLNHDKIEVHELP